MTSGFKGIFQSGTFYVEHLNPNSIIDMKTILDFTIDTAEGQGLSIYLKDCARQDEYDRVMRTYLVRDIETEECVGYFSLKAGLISINETKTVFEDTNTGINQTVKEFDTLPGVELANFAVNSSFINQYPYLKGIGHVIFTEFILPIISKAAEYIGIKLVYIYALPYEKLIKRYERYGFRSLPESEEIDLHKRLKPRYDQSCKFMYLILQ